MGKTAIFQKSIVNDEVVEIVYHGGSQPGTKREIAPINMKDGKLRAYCYSSGMVKSFFIEKIDIVRDTNTDKTKEWRLEAIKGNTYESLADILKKHQDELSDFGWYVDFNEDFISLYRYFKNGKLRKGSDLSIHYDKFIYDYTFVDDDGNMTDVIKKRQRPWSVRGKGGDCIGTFKHLDNAVNVFIDTVTKLAEKYF